MHYNPSLSIAGNRDIGWRISGGTAGYCNLGGDMETNDQGESEVDELEVDGALHGEREEEGL